MKTRVINDVISHSGKCCHPRIMLTASDFSRIRNSTDELDVAGRSNVIKKADYYLTQPPKEYSIPDGIRLLQVSREVLDRSLHLGMAYRLTDDARYAERLYKELEAVIAFSDWNPYHFLDVGEMSNAVGIAYDWIYDWMNESQRRRVREAIVSHAFMPAMDDYKNNERRRSYRWYQDTPGDNWKFVCNGGITVAALAICDEDGIDRALLEEVFGYAYENTYRAVRDMYFPDGSYVEGFTYWMYATDYLAYYVSALKSACGTDYGLSDYEPVKTSAYYVKSICSNRFICFNFGDAWEANLCAPIFLWLGKNYEADEIFCMRRDYLRQSPSDVTVRDLLWLCDVPHKSLDSLPLSLGGVGATNATFRAGWEIDDLFCAIHFGDNDVPHAHADTGVFIVEYKCRRFLCELSADNYNVGKYRNTYRYRAEGHNTIVINPSAAPDQAADSECYIDRFCNGEGGREPYAICDMSEAYFGKGAVRGMRLAKNGKCVIIQDELTLDESDCGLWFAHTTADITLSDDKRRATLTIDGESMYLTVIGGGELEIMEAKHMFDELYQPHQMDNSMYKKLAVRFSGTSTVSVAISTSEDIVPELIPLKDW